MGNLRRYIKTKFENWLPKMSEVNDQGWWHYFWMNQAAKSFYGGGSLKFSNSNAYCIATNLAEVFFPIDAIADRVAGLQFDIVNSDGEIVTPPKNIERLLEKPNPFCESFSSLVYDSVFNELSDGNNWIYTKTPRSFSGGSVDTISSVWVLQPDLVDVNLKRKGPSIFDIKDITDVVDSIVYTKYGKDIIDPKYIIHERSLGCGDYSCGLKSKSPLNPAEKNINNLLAVYEARFNVYDKNGMAGILSKKQTPQSQEQVYADAVTRESIIEDITNRNGLTGDKKFWSVSPVPLEFIKTLATIQELQPFDETWEDARQIAGIFGVDESLLPCSKGTTFNNKRSAEKSLYQNVVKGVANDKAKTLTKAFYLNTIGLKFRPNYEDVEVLQEDVEISHRGDGLLLDNMKKLKELDLMNKEDQEDIANRLIEKMKNG